MSLCFPSAIERLLKLSPSMLVGVVHAVCLHIRYQRNRVSGKNVFSSCLPVLDSFPNLVLPPLHSRFLGIYDREFSGPFLWLSFASLLPDSSFFVLCLSLV